MHALCMVHLTMHTILDIPHNNCKVLFHQRLLFSSCYCLFYSRIVQTWTVTACLRFELICIIKLNQLSLRFLICLDYIFPNRVIPKTPLMMLLLLSKWIFFYKHILHWSFAVQSKISLPMFQFVQRFQVSFSLYSSV